MIIRSFVEWINEGVDFKENFTPLYHITSFSSLEVILKTDLLKASNVSRGPRGICLTRSKFFEHGGFSCRLILNYEKLKLDGYRTYPLDEWALSPPKFDNGNRIYPTNRKDWMNKDLKNKKHFGKSNFSKLIGGQRPISHNIKGLPNDKESGLEVEYEERILKDIKNLGKYIYGINFVEFINRNKDYYYDAVKEYLQKYPHIKIFKGQFFLKEVTLEDILK